MKKEKSKQIKKEESRWIDVHNDEVMREMGLLRPYLQAPRDESVWTKTSHERKALKSVKRYKKRDMHFHTVPNKFIPVRDRLIIYLKKNKVYPKTTYSIECFQNNIPDILADYTIFNRKSNIYETAVLKYSWNGKTYKSGELPFWGN